VRLLTFSLVLFASNAFASPVTFLFTGEVTRIYMANGFEPNKQVITTDPNDYASWNGATILNGNTSVRIPRMSVGDSASCRSRVPPHVGRLKGAGRGTFCSVAFFN
jgi:hypothetical protein